MPPARRGVACAFTPPRAFHTTQRVSSLPAAAWLLCAPLDRLLPRAVSSPLLLAPGEQTFLLTGRHPVRGASDAALAARASAAVAPGGGVAFVGLLEAGSSVTYHISRTAPLHNSQQPALSCRPAQGTPSRRGLGVVGGGRRRTHAGRLGHSPFSSSHQLPRRVRAPRRARQHWAASIALFHCRFMGGAPAHAEELLNLHPGARAPASRSPSFLILFNLLFFFSSSTDGTTLLLSFSPSLLLSFSPSLLLSFSPSLLLSFPLPCVGHSNGCRDTALTTAGYLVRHHPGASATRTTEKISLILSDPGYIIYWFQNSFAREAARRTARVRAQALG